jgi:hypothetical protein
MSFVEKNKRWLLPVIGAGVAGVVWMNLPDRSAQTPLPAPLPGVENAPAAPVLEERYPAGAGRGTDPQLKALDAPPPAVYEPAPLLLAGRQALAAELRSPARPPLLHPDQWRALCALPEPVSATSDAQPLPPLNFIISSRAGNEAWMGGIGYRRGAVVRDGFVLSSINADGVLLSGPSGMVAIPLKSSAPPPEPRKGTTVQP